MRFLAIWLLLPTIAVHTVVLRLPEIYDSIKYDLHFQFLQDVFTKDGNDFNGTAKISFKFTKIPQHVVMHANDDFIRITHIKFNNVDLPSDDYNTNRTTETLRIKVPHSVDPHVQHEIVIQYKGFVESHDVMGLYKSSHVVNGTRHYVIATHFHPYFARRVFPCFDEPGFKAEFLVAITAPFDKLVLSNAPRSTEELHSDRNGRLQTVQFAITPKMPISTLAFSVTDFSCTRKHTALPFGVCSRTPTAGSREFALLLGPKVLDYYGNFTGIAYSSMIKKMDTAAIPDSFSGGMENWGMVTFRETDLLFDSNRSSDANKQRVALTLIHEFSHQWFGNLVTMKWWSETYLSEGFGTYFEYFATNEFFPEWQTDKQFVVEKMHAALEEDAFETSLSLNSSSETIDTINAKYGFVSYSKGASVLRMVKHLLGPDRFAKALRSFLQKHQYSSVVSRDLLDALNNHMDKTYTIPPADVPTILKNWISEPGYPIIDVKLSGKSVVVSQARPLISGEESKVKWYVPITYTTSTDTEKFSDKTRSWLLPNEKSSVITTLLDSWIILNNHQIGYYRVDYDSNLLSRITNALNKENHDGITEINRAQIVDDLFAMAKYNRTSYSKVLNAIKFLKKDTSYFSWYAAVKGLDYVLSRTGDDVDLRRELQRDILYLVDYVYKSLPFDPKEGESQISVLKRDLIFSFACRLGNAHCVKESKKRFEDYAKRNIRPHRNLGSLIYCNGIRYSTNSADWDFLWEEYKEAQDLATEQVAILSGLACSRNATLLKRLLLQTIDNRLEIRAQDAWTVFALVYSSSAEGVDVAIDFFIHNHGDIFDKYKNMLVIGDLLIGAASKVTTERNINKLKMFAKETNNLPKEFVPIVEEAVKSAEKNLESTRDCKNDVKKYLNKAGRNVA